MRAPTAAGMSIRATRGPTCAMSPNALARRASATWNRAYPANRRHTSAIDIAAGRKPVANPVMDFGTGEIVALLVMISEMPRNVSRPASVTMNEGTPMRVTHQPFQAPSAMPAMIATGTAMSGSISMRTVNQATTTPTRATADPTDRSMLRVTMSITALIAASAVMVVWSASRVRLRCDRKMPFVSTWNTSHVTTTTSSRV